MFKFFIFLFYFIFCNNNKTEYKSNNIFFKFNIDTNNINFKKFNASCFLNQNHHINIKSSIIIGNPSQNIDVFFKSEQKYFQFTNNYDFETINKYEPSKSKDKKEINTTLNSNYIINDVFYDSFKLNFILNTTINKEKKYIGNIGLNLDLLDEKLKNPSFIKQLKKKKIIKGYNWSFIFNGKNSGEIIIGDDLTNYDKYKNYKYFLFNSQLYYGNVYWCVKFNKVFLKDLNDIDDEEDGKINIVDMISSMNAVLDINLGVIIGTSEYKKKIDNLFFNKYISNGICDNDIEVSNYDMNEYYVYYCDKKKLDLNLMINDNYFPDLVFYSYFFCFGFELTKQDLFTDINGIYYFNIIFKAGKIVNDLGVWKLGIPFFIKYTFTFNMDAKTIGFYNPSIKPDKEDKKNNVIENESFELNNSIEKVNIISNNTIIIYKNNNLYINIIKIILIFLGGIFLIVISHTLIKKVNLIKKKRANELKDNYDYIPDNSEEKSKQFIELKTNNNTI